MSNEHVNEQRKAKQKVQITVLMKRKCLGSFEENEFTDQENTSKHESSNQMFCNLILRIRM